jgi:hypothetical protein
MLRDEQTDSIWAHTEGVAVSGELKGTVLEPHPIFQATWEEWVRLYPESEILVWPEDSSHRDGRHGHGARDYLGRPGIRAGRGFGVKPGVLDERLRENELVLGVSHPSGNVAYPIRNLHTAGGVSNETLGDDPIVVWSPTLDSHITGGFLRTLEGVGVLSFRNQNGRLTDQETRSLWTVDGRAIEGPLAGKTLRPLDCVFLKWHVWSSYHPESRIAKQLNLLNNEHLPNRVFSSFLEALEAAGFSTSLDGMVFKAHLPNLAVRGLLIKINEDPFILHEFENRLGAREYCWVRAHVIRVGQYVLQSEPEKQFADAANLKPLPDEEMAWSEMLDSQELHRVMESALPSAESEEGDDPRGLPRVLDHLGELGYAVAVVGQLECRRMPPKAINGYDLEFSASHGHSLQAGTFVFRSDPPIQYKSMVLKSVSLEDDEITWSCLLEDGAFVAALAEAVTG